MAATRPLAVFFNTIVATLLLKEKLVSSDIVSLLLIVIGSFLLIMQSKPQKTDWTVDELDTAYTQKKVTFIYVAYCFFFVYANTMENIVRKRLMGYHARL